MKVDSAIAIIKGNTYASLKKLPNFTYRVIAIKIRMRYVKLVARSDSPVHDKVPIVAGVNTLNDLDRK